MPTPFNYKTESNRYNYYYRRLKVFYQKPVTQVSTAVLFTLGTILFFAIFAIRPTLVTIGELLKKIESQKQVLQKAERKAAALTTAQQLYSQASGKIYVLDQAIPSEYQVQQILLSLESTIGNMSVPINNLSVSDIVYPPKASAQNEVLPLEFSISFDASYPDAKKIITNLQQLPRLTSLDSITFSQSVVTRRTDTTSPVDKITTNLNFRTFYLPKGTQ